MEVPGRLSTLFMHDVISQDLDREQLCDSEPSSAHGSTPTHFLVIVCSAMTYMYAVPCGHRKIKKGTSASDMALNSADRVRRAPYLTSPKHLVAEPGTRARGRSLQTREQLGANQAVEQLLETA